jgi:hypothetical protein
MMCAPTHTRCVPSSCGDCSASPTLPSPPPRTLWRFSVPPHLPLVAFGVSPAATSHPRELRHARPLSCRVHDTTPSRSTTRMRSTRAGRSPSPAPPRSPSRLSPPSSPHMHPPTRLRLSCSGIHMRSLTCVSSSSPTLLQSPATLPDLIKREDAAAGGQRVQGSRARRARDMESACALNVSRIGVRLVPPTMSSIAELACTRLALHLPRRFMLAHPLLHASTISFMCQYCNSCVLVCYHVA